MNRTFCTKEIVQNLHHKHLKEKSIRLSEILWMSETVFFIGVAYKENTKFCKLQALKELEILYLKNVLT